MDDIRYVLTRYQAGILACSIDVQQGRLETLQLYEDPARDGREASDIIHIGDIFVAKVMNIAQNINSAFIDYQKGRHGYLSLEKTGAPILLNREYDGRIKAGDELLVQLEKEAVRSKDPVFTADLSLAGKYCVITSGNRKKGVSKKCSRTVREQLAQAIPADIDLGVIVRTNAEELISEEDSRLELLERECRSLASQMYSLLSDGRHRTCYSKVKQAPAPYLTFLRDIRRMHYSRIMTDDAALYDELAAFLRDTSPDLYGKLYMYTDTGYPLNKLYAVETKIRALTSERVWLKSGAYLVIEKTEAMYVIDVNSGKNVSKRSSSESILSVNMEAAKEIMYQLRLRNLTGIIIIDFINMEERADQETLLQGLKKYARRDMIPTTVVDMTALGLVEITRQKNLKSLAEQLRSVRI